MERIKVILLSACLFLALNVQGQTQAQLAVLDSTEISLLTCEPFHEIYSLYGHTGIRVCNHARHQDVVVNWGVFDMTQSWFALKFMFGITDYWMAVQPTSQFLDEYRYFNCGILEQVLNLTPKEKLDIINALEENSQPGNQQYRYNFLYDNCTTRARDMIMNNVGRKSGSEEVRKRGNSFREEIHQWNEGHPWYRWGNDILLGVKADIPTTAREREFIPDTLCAHFASTSLVKSTHWLLPPQYVPAKISTAERLLLGPWLIVWVTTAILLLSRYTRWGYVLEGLLYEVTGIVGLLLMAMIFSQHPTVSLNLQMLVFNPVCLWIGYKTLRGLDASKVRKFYAYCLLLSLPLGILLQHFAEGVIGLALVLLVSNIKTLRFEKK